jgi:hypothetical protein
MARLRNLAITILGPTGHASIAAALRYRPPAQPTASNDHELQADNFAKALVPVPEP